MSEGLKFLNEFFMKKKYEMNNITITLDERACYDINTEDYRFRVNISEVIDEIDIRYRDVAIEDHHNQEKHQKPHLQFKLHADGVGNIYIFLPVENINEYKKFILSFLDMIGNILLKLDNKEKDIQKEFMIIESFAKISGMSENLKNIIFEKYKNKELCILDFDKKERLIGKEDLEKIKKIPQIAPFFEKL